MNLFPSTAAVADYTRCILAAIMYAGTLAAILMGRSLPQEWWYAFFGVTGFFFAMELPPLAKRIMAALADVPKEEPKP